MNTITFGIRNALRNVVRSISIVVILGLSIGLSLTMLIAHQAVNNKIKTVEGSIGNTITVSPAGFSSFSSVNNALSTSQLSKVSSLPHVTNVEEELTGRLTTIGSSTPSFGFGGQQSNSSTTDQTSLSSPIKLNVNRGGTGGGNVHVFLNGSSNLPANFSLPVTIVGTNDPTSVDGATLTLKSGTEIDATKDNNEAMVSASMANKNKLKVGSTFTAYGKTLTAEGIFSSSTTAGSGDIIVSLPTEQALSGQSGDVTSATVTVDSLSNLNSVTTAVKNTLGSSADVTSAQAEATNTVAPLNGVKSVSLYSLIGATIAGSVIILLTMIMIVRERRREIGVLKAIGASSARVISQFMVEAVTLTLIAAIVGIGLGVVAANPITNILVNNSTTSTSSTVSATTSFAPGGGGGRFFGGNGFAGRIGGGGRFLNHNFQAIHAAASWSILLYGLGAAILIAIIGSACASWMITKIRPSEVMRTE